MFNCVQPSCTQSFFEKSVIESVAATAKKIETNKSIVRPKSPIDLTLDDSREEKNDETLYDKSFSHPMLKTNNKIFTPGYRNNLLTNSQCDSSLNNEPEPPKDSFSIEPSEMEVSIEPELPDLPTQPPSPPEPPTPTRVESPKLADWGNEKNKQQGTRTDDKVSNSDDDSLFDQLNETNVNLEIRTIEDTLSHFAARTDGSIIKYSKEGDSFTFHEFWLRVRCPALIAFNTRRLNSVELKHLHHIIYSTEKTYQTASQPASQRRQTTVSQRSTDDLDKSLPDEKSFVFRTRTSTLANENETAPIDSDVANHDDDNDDDESDHSAALFDNSNTSNTTPLGDKNISISNFDFDPSADELSVRSASPSPVLNTKSARMSGLNASILLNSASRKRSITTTPQRPTLDSSITTPRRKYRRYSRPKKSIFTDSDDDSDNSSQELIPKRTSKIVNVEPIEIDSSDDAMHVDSVPQPSSAPTTPQKSVKSLQRRSVSYNPQAKKVLPIERVAPPPSRPSSSPQSDTPINLADYGLSEDKKLSKIEKKSLMEMCLPYGLKKTMGKRAMESKLNEIYGMYSEGGCGVFSALF